MKGGEENMSDNLKKFIQYEGKMYWVDLHNWNILVVNPDGTYRQALTSEVNLMDMLNEGHASDIGPDNFIPPNGKIRPEK